MQKIFLGIDPSTTNLGVGVIMAEGHELSYLLSTTIVPPKNLSSAEKLSMLYQALEKIITDQEKTAPITAIALEKIFYHVSATVAFRLGEARGMVLSLAGKHHIKVVDVAPRSAKKNITGSGRADKEQMLRMIQLLLPKANPKTDHEADALALALSVFQDQTGEWQESP